MLVAGTHRLKSGRAALLDEMPDLCNSCPFSGGLDPAALGSSIIDAAPCCSHDLRLIPNVRQNVFQSAFDALNARVAGSIPPARQG